MKNIKNSKFYSILKTLMYYSFQFEPRVEVKSPWFYANQHGISYKI